MAGMQNCFLGAGSIILGAVYGYFGRKFLEGSIMVTTSSSLYTETLSWFMMLFGLLLLGRGVVTLRSGGKDPVSTSGGPSLRRVLPFLLVAAAYAWSLEVLGFALASIASGIVFLLIMGERSILRLILVPGVFTLVVYLMFTKLLFVDLPQGDILAWWLDGGSHGG